MEEEEAEEEAQASARKRDKVWKGLRKYADRCQYMSIAHALNKPPGSDAEVWLFAVVCQIGAAVKSRGTGE